VSSLHWAVADGWTMTRRDLAHWARHPAPVLVGLLFPILLVLMFGYLLGGAIAVPGGGDYREFLLPGMFVMTMGFGVESTLLAVTTDAARGVTDRFRSMPMSPSAVVVGRCGADLLNSVLVLAVMAACGLAVGWRPHGGVGATLGAFGLLLLLRFAFLWVGVYLGLVVSDPSAVTLVQTVIWPVTFLSNVFVSPASMPGWLGAIATWNPLSATAAATRELFGNPGAAAGWLGVAAVWPLLLVAVFFPLSVRAFRRLSR
jgi:ABC-type multidrug transport system permease subunit